MYNSSRLIVTLIFFLFYVDSSIGESRKFPESELRSYAKNWSHAPTPSAPKETNFQRTLVPFTVNSNGSGGETGFVERNFTASNGKSARFKLDVPDDIGVNQSYGVLLYLHGDGGYDYNWFFGSVQRVAEENHLIAAAAMCPTRNANGPSWWWDADANAIYLNELIQHEILAKYNIDETQMIFSGASGGSTFSSGPWIRHFASQFRGGAVLMCGGLVKTGFDFQDAPGFRQNFPIFLYNGGADFLLDLAKQSARYYRKHGMNVTQEILPGAGHCKFSMEQILEERVAKIVGRASF